MAEVNVLQANERARSAVLAKAADCLIGGGVVVAPTETRYGLLGRADNAAVVERLCRLKQRPQGAPFSVFVPDLAALERVAVLSETARRLARRFLPGPLTLVSPARVEFPWPVVVDGSIGVRVSSSGLIAGLVRAAGTPLTATSANLSGAPDAETIDQITAVFGDGVDLYLDGGALTGPVSTVVDCRGDGVRVLRRGAIAAVEVEEELKEGRDG